MNGSASKVFLLVDSNIGVDSALENQKNRQINVFATHHSPHYYDKKHVGGRKFCMITPKYFSIEPLLFFSLTRNVFLIFERIAQSPP